MRILIISENVGKNAPGIVYDKLIEGLSLMHDIDLLTADYQPVKPHHKVKNVYSLRKWKIHEKLPKIFIGLFNINPIDVLWTARALKLVKAKNQQYDLVFSFISFHNYSALIAGVKFSKINRIKLAVYSVDAIPAPFGWSKKDLYFEGVQNMMREYLSKADFFFSSNEAMLNYQLTTFKRKNNLITDVIYTPHTGDLFIYPPSEKNVFLFTGGIYGARNPGYIIEAFKKLLNIYEDSQIEFVGSRLPHGLLDSLEIKTRQKILIHPYTTDLTPFYARATALVDIDGDLQNDIYLSSKMSTYICINRTIISETGKNSPSYKLFNGIPSIKQCGHNVDELYHAMTDIIQKNDVVDFIDRKEVISLFDLRTVVMRINSVLEKKR